MNGKFKKTMQITEAADYLSKAAKMKGVEAELDLADFEKCSGVGIVVTDEDIYKAVDKAFEE